MKRIFIIIVTAILIYSSLMMVFAQQLPAPLLPPAPAETPQERAARSNGGDLLRPYLPSLSGRMPVPAYYRKQALMRLKAKSCFAAGDLGGAEKACLASLAAGAGTTTQHPNPEVEQLLGRIYLQEGKYQKAIPYLQACNPYIHQEIRGLDLTVAYTRLGDYPQARNYYSDRLLQNHHLSEKPLIASDLPSTSNRQGIEASALLELGLDDFMHADRDKALAKLLTAEQLAPNSIMISYYIGKLMGDKGRYEEAIPRLEKVMASPRGNIFYDPQGQLYNAKIYVQRAQRAAQK